MFFPEIHFIDLHGDLTKHINTKLQQLNINKFIKYQALNQNIITYKNDSNTIFVSPANSLGFMDGGIDYVLSRQMFPQVEKTVKQYIKNLNFKNIFNQNFLPVGSSLIVPVSLLNSKNQYLISAPTMLLPQNINKTNNCYYAMYAILRIAHKYNNYLRQNNKQLITKIVCPGLGTGIGKISESDAADQVCLAMEHFIKYDVNHFSVLDNNIVSSFEDKMPQSSVYFIRDPDYILKKQPRYYQNSAYFTIPPKDIVISKLS
jgi:O-acetyl-ADP-ribose deacetylase (regulator of RNase III)